MKFIKRFQKKFTVSAIITLVFTFVLTATLLDSCCIYGAPGFKNSPIVKDLNSTKILVSWKDSMNEYFECADEFYVYLWKTNNETRDDAQMHHRTSNNFSYEIVIEVSKSTNYTLQIEAREISHGGCWLAKSGLSDEFFHTTKGSSTVHELNLIF